MQINQHDNSDGTIAIISCKGCLYFRIIKRSNLARCIHPRGNDVVIKNLRPSHCPFNDIYHV